MLEGSKACELPGFLASYLPSLKPFAISYDLILLPGIQASSSLTDNYELSALSYELFT
jgi:hypothetical protein